MRFDYANYPGIGITRLRYYGYNLSLIVRHPLKCRDKDTIIIGN